MRTLAIGDIHGCLRSLDALLGAVKLQANDLIVTLGDYVDRGPDSLGVMNRLIRLSKTHRLIALRGNHEQMMMEARESAGQLAVWREYGGDAALKSYDVLEDGGNLADVPDEHWDFLDSYCRDWFETEKHLFVHAGVYPDLPMAEQPVYILRWEVFSEPAAHESGKVWICGHTPQREGWPRSVGHAICIDTGVFKRRGWLTCLDVEKGWVWQSNEAGEVRVGWLDDGAPQEG